MTGIRTTHRGSDYISKKDPKQDIITVEPVANHITCETNIKILGYRDLVKMDLPVWKNSMCNKLGRLSQGWKANTGTDKIEFIFNKDKPRDRREIYMEFHAGQF